MTNVKAQDPKYRFVTTLDGHVEGTHITRKRATIFALELSHLIGSCDCSVGSSPGRMIYGTSKGGPAWQERIACGLSTRVKVTREFNGR